MKLQSSGFLSALLLVTFDCCMSIWSSDSDIELHGTNAF